MAVIDTSVTNDMLDEAIGDATNGLVKIKLIYGDATESLFKAVTWGVAASGEIDITSSIVFDIAAGDAVASMYLFHNDETTPGILYTFETTYQYNTEGSFTISSIPISVG